MYTAKFFNLAITLFPDYLYCGYIPQTEQCVYNKIQDYVHANKHIFHPGDILFVGSKHETQQYKEGFAIIGNDYTVYISEYGAVSLPIIYRNQIPTHITYSNVLHTINQIIECVDPFNYDLVFYDFYNQIQGNESEMITTVKHTYISQGIY